MTHDKFYNVKAFQETWSNNFNIDEDRTQVKWHDIKILRVEKEHPGAFLYKTSFADKTFKKTFLRKRRAENQHFITVDLTRAYTGKFHCLMRKEMAFKNYPFLNCQL